MNQNIYFIIYFVLSNKNKLLLLLLLYKLTIYREQENYSKTKINKDFNVI